MGKSKSFEESRESWMTPHWFNRVHSSFFLSCSFLMGQKLILSLKLIFIHCFCCLTTARDNLVFLQRWFVKFPQYKNRSMFLTGESYAGTWNILSSLKLNIYNTIKLRLMLRIKTTLSYYDINRSLYSTIGRANASIQQKRESFQSQRHCCEYSTDSTESINI